MGLIVWFEPERVTPGTFLYTNNPAWLLGRDGEQKLLNLGNPDARQWLTDHVDAMLTREGIDFYRQDFNMDPLAYWRAQRRAGPAGPHARCATSKAISPTGTNCAGGTRAC